MRGSTTNRYKVYSLIGDNHGVVTLAMAKEIGVPAVEMRKLAHRGALERVGRGVYRIPFAPTGSIQIAAEYLAIIGEGAYISGSTVPTLLQIGLFNPRRLEITTPNRYRGQVPEKVRLKRVAPEQAAKVVYYYDLPCQSVFDSLVSVLSFTDSDQFYTAIYDAEQYGYIGKLEARKLKRMVEDRDLERRY
jgi:hypothetical protein